MGNFISNFFDSVTGKSAERKATAAITASVNEALRALGVSNEAAERIMRNSMARADELIEGGANETEAIINATDEIARGEFGQGFDDAMKSLIDQSAKQEQTLAETAEEAGTPLERFTQRGLQRFESGLGSAARNIAETGGRASEAAQAGAEGAIGAAGAGFGEAQALGQPLVGAGATGLQGLEQFVADDSPFLQRQLEQSAEAINADLARKGLYGSTGGAQVVGEAAQDILEQNEQQKLAVLGQLAGLGAAQTGTQQQLATQAGLTEADILRQQGMTEAQIQQALGQNLADVNRQVAQGRLQTDTNLGQNLSNIALQTGLGTAGVQGSLGAGLSQLGLGRGQTLGQLASQTGGAQATLAQQTAGQRAGLQSGLGQAQAGRELGLGSDIANLMTGKGAGIAQANAARSRTQTGLLTGLMGAAGSYFGGK